MPIVAPPAHLRRALRYAHHEGRNWLSARFTASGGARVALASPNVVIE
jgi:hypothetical protein